MSGNIERYPHLSTRITVALDALDDMQASPAWPYDQPAYWQNDQELATRTNAHLHFMDQERNSEPS